LCGNQFSRKIPRNSPKLYYQQRPPRPEGQLEGTTGPPKGGQMPPLAAPGGPLEAQSHLSGSPSVFRSLRNRNGELLKDFPNIIRRSADTRNPSLGFRSSCSRTLSGQGLEGRSSPPTPLHQPSMIPPLMCEYFPPIGRRDGRDWM
jgi:hypothetical protein